MMGERIPPGTYFQYPPSGVPASPDRPSVLHTDSERYLAELLAEKQKLGPFTQVLPLCTRLLNQDCYRGFIVMSALSRSEGSQVLILVLWIMRDLSMIVLLGKWATAKSCSSSSCINGLAWFARSPYYTNCEESC
ncbi:KH domain-containing protein At4g26480-like isoform X1 [Durio zibethinus]|uniref:KH domain-containing protein At4g26480-like isoform X1 n=1 Tax=Durio zibethinus TaxID=66656 RepID=A0A6P6AD07_DURZI|nr:KH domain-containing protein At4g26480-like isoform X1 [Durio zibethinus]XP_022762737.1 KH domain-containing protein At4g26480-like isoform X1 [Durio zibethinus]